MNQLVLKGTYFIMYIMPIEPMLRIRDVLSRVRIRPFSHPGFKHYFIPDPESYMKGGMQTYFFLASYAFRSKVLVFVIVKKIRIRVPGTGSRTQGIKKHLIPDQDPQHCIKRNLEFELGYLIQ
jgi:hypothetical protein